MTETALTVEQLTDRVRIDLEIIEDDLLNYLFIEAVNVSKQNAFKYVTKRDRILLIPHCLRDAEACIAPIDDDGYHCQKCGACVISEITTAADERGIKWYMVGGGSHAVRIMKEKLPKAVIGIACFDEANLALEKIEEYSLPAQAVLLSKAGCVNTEVDLDKVLEKLDISDIHE